MQVNIDNSKLIKDIEYNITKDRTLASQSLKQKDTTTAKKDINILNESILEY